MTFIHQGTPNQQAITRAAIAACDYPFERLATPVTISWRDLTADGAYGLYWPGQYKIEVDTSIENRPLLAQQVAVAETWHAVDDQTVTDDMRRLIIAAWHAVPDQHQWFPDDDNYAAWVGEAMMFGFSLAFAPTLGISGLEAQFTHRTTPDVAAKVRRILLGAPPEITADMLLARAFRAWRPGILSRVTKAGQLAKAGDAWLASKGL